MLTCSLLAGCLIVLLLETPNAVREVRLGIAGPYGDVDGPVAESLSRPTVAIPFRTVQAAEPAMATEREGKGESLERVGEIAPILASLPE